MKLQAEIADKKHDVEIVRDGREVHARVGDRSYQLDVAEFDKGVFLIKNGSTIFEASVNATADGISRVNVKDQSFEVKIIDPKRLRSSGTGDAAASGKAEIKTAMPGKVVRILKARGDAVEKGEGVIVVEAMKMQNEMKSPKDGSITEIKFAEGDTVAAGDVLVAIE